MVYGSVRQFTAGRCTQRCTEVPTVYGGCTQRCTEGQPSVVLVLILVGFVGRAPVGPSATASDGAGTDGSVPAPACPVWTGVVRLRSRLPQATPSAVIRVTGSGTPQATPSAVYVRQGPVRLRLRLRLYMLDRVRYASGYAFGCIRCYRSGMPQATPSAV